MSNDDYSPYTGIGTDYAHLPEWRIEAGVKRGREPEFMEFLIRQPDESSQRLLGFANQKRRKFPRLLADWVRERLDLDLMIPESVDWQRKAS